MFPKSVPSESTGAEDSGKVRAGLTVPSPGQEFFAWFEKIQIIMDADVRAVTR